MTLAAGGVIEIHQGGASANAGYFNPTNANMATDGAATTATGVPVFTSASYNFVAGDVGAYVFIKSGTNWIPGWYKIASVASNAATLTATIGSSVLWQGTTVLNTATGCATVASPTAATWTVDYSQQNAAAFAFTDLASTIGTTNPSTFTSAAHPIGKNMVGNGVNVTAGTNWTVQRFEVVSVSGTTGTADRALGSVAALSSGTANLGGACAFLTDVTGFYVSSNKIFVKADATYLQTATATFAVATAPSNTIPRTIIQGFTTTRGDGGRPTIQLTTNTGLTAISLTATGHTVDHIIVDCHSLGTSTGVSSTANNNTITNCKISNFTTVGITSNSALFQSVMNELTGGTSAATAAINIITAAQQFVIFNWVHDNVCPGIICATSGQTVAFNLVTNNTGASSDGISVTSGSLVMNNTVYGSGRDGLHSAGVSFNQGGIVRGNIFAKNAGWGLNATNSAFAASIVFDGNGYWSNTSGTRNDLGDLTIGNDGVAPYVNTLDVLISGTSPTNDPFVNDGGGDFRLNGTAGAGALLIGTAFPGTLPGDTHAGFLSFGCLQPYTESPVAGNLRGGFIN